MNKKILIKNGLAVAVILLFICVAFAPSINADINKASENEILKPHTVTVVDESDSETLGDNIFSKSILLTTPEIQQVGDYSRIHIKDETSQTMKTKKPLLPVVTRVFLFPFKTKIKDVSVCFYGVKEKKISNPICLAPEQIPSICTKRDTVALPFENGIKSYDSVLYPEKRYKCHVGAGRHDDKIVNYLSVNLYPVQYDSSDNIVYYWNKADISIRYELPQKPITLGDEYDLIIITPLWFSQELKPLVDHKNNHSIRSKLVTLNEIYGDVYFPVEGRDRAENVKYFIKHALDEWGIKYVLLVGGRKGGLFEPKWWVPARYSHLDDNYEESYLCDLYFADIYDAHGNFSSWDTTENDVFAEWKSHAKDILDMYPDVHVGRLACKNVFEVKTMVDKIIAYENTAYGSEWFNKFVGVAGDTSPKNNYYYEGEMETEAAFNYLDGFNVSYLWTSTGEFTCKQDVIDEVNKGCGFMLFSGHGTPLEWGNHPPKNESWIDAPTAFEMDELTNGGKLPIVLVGGCHNSQFDTSLLNFLKGILENGLQYFIKPHIWSGGNYWAHEWVPKCWAWSMASQIEGGCIAIIGGSGLGYGIDDEDCLTGRGIFLRLQFFRSYNEGKDILGETHSAELIHYLNEFPPMDEKIDCKTAQQWVLLGDPSLKIGGYPPNY